MLWIVTWARRSASRMGGRYSKPPKHLPFGNTLLLPLNFNSIFECRTRNNAFIYNLVFLDGCTSFHKFSFRKLSYLINLALLVHTPNQVCKSSGRPSWNSGRNRPVQSTLNLGPERPGRFVKPEIYNPAQNWSHKKFQRVFDNWKDNFWYFS